MTFEKEFKEAIDALPSKEKTKLILRLLKKDLVLCNRLYFELISDESVEERRDRLKNKQLKTINRFTEYFYSPGELLMNLRDLSGEITEHLKTTKDKYGEIELLIFMLTETLKKNRENLLRFSASKNLKLNVYIVAKVFKILLLIDKMHEDERYDFKESLNVLGMEMSKNDDLMKATIYHGLDMNWLIGGEIPENISEIHKELRANGYLR
ncbi:hypothetical protein [Riemerella columbina]|uniref:hypothetical protein n=1 Tax=Riemerella columbina TaxID=103810 RepID=UPI00037EEB6C|nr:hypothetical protein [Riemerella columbina]